ncbi:MAG: Ig-like domain-containing protein, partial [Aeromicrobium sp.]
MTDTSTRLRRTGAGVATGALVAAGLLVAPSAQAATTTANVRENDIAKYGAATTGWYQASATGEFQVVNEGLSLTSGTQILKTNATSADLTDVGAATVAVTTGSAASFEAVVTDADITDGPATLRPTAAPDEWVSDKTIGSITAGVPATLAAFDTQLDAGTAYTISAFGVESVTGTNVVTSITFDDAQYTFGNNAPIAKNRSYTTKVEKAVSVNLASTDVDGNALTYDATVTSGTLSGTGERRTFTPAKGFKGSAAVKYTVTDNRGGTDTGVITVNVVKLKGAVEIYRIHPSKPSIRSTVSVYATIRTDGKAATKGSTVYVYAKGKKVGTGKVNSVGKVKLKLPNKLPYGKATLKVTQAGSSKLSGGTDSVAVRVRK